MIFVVEHPINVGYLFDNDIDILNGYTIGYEQDSNGYYHLIPQKIALSEVDMNWVFANIRGLLTVPLRYAWLSDTGEFAISNEV